MLKKAAALLCAVFTALMLYGCACSPQNVAGFLAPPSITATPAPTASPTPTVRPTSRPTDETPEGGETFYYTYDEEVASFKATVPEGGESYYLILADEKTGKRVVSMFLEPGMSAETLVPLGTYKLYYGIGKEWVDDEEIFGGKASYMEAKDPLVFSQEGDTYIGNEVTLVQIATGNLETESVALSGMPE